MFPNPEQAFGGTSALLETIETIYSAVQDPSLWKVALARIAEAIEGESLALFAFSPDYRSPNILALANVAPDVWTSFANYYAALNPLMPRAERTYVDGETVFNEALMPDAELERTEFYNDFYLPNRMHHTVGMTLNVDGVTAAFTCQRPKPAGAFGSHADIVCQTLRPHLLRALQLHRKMGLLQASTLGLEAALAAHEHAVFGIDASLRVLVCNSSAETLLANGDPVRGTDGRLSCARVEDTRALQKLLLQAVNVTSTALGGAILVHRRTGPPLVVSVSPFRFSVPGYSSPLAALVFLADPSAAPRTRADAMRAVYGLTPAECRVADMLLGGLDVREICERMAVKPDTVRYHLKQIFAKTGTRRQTELIRRMLALPTAIK